eukprot:12156424-Karenia_brevis.AAC.1
MHARRKLGVLAPGAPSQSSDFLETRHWIRAKTPPPPSWHKSVASSRQASDAVEEAASASSAMKQMFGEDVALASPT